MSRNCEKYARQLIYTRARKHLTHTSLTSTLRACSLTHAFNHFAPQGLWTPLKDFKSKHFARMSNKLVHGTTFYSSILHRSTLCSCHVLSCHVNSFFSFEDEIVLKSFFSSASLNHPKYMMHSNANFLTDRYS